MSYCDDNGCINRKRNNIEDPIALYNKKQPSVEWLFRKLWDTSKDKLTWYAFLKEAMEMHREEILNAYTASGVSMMSAEQFYEEYFNK